MSHLARMTLTALVVALLLVAGCASLTRPWMAPEVVPVGLRIAALSLQRQVFVVTLGVKNPNDRTLPIKAMTYRLSLEGNALAEGASALDRPIPAFGESLVEVEVAGDLLALVQQLPVLALEHRPLDWTIAGTVTIAGTPLRLPYRYSGQIDAQALLAGALAARPLPR